MTGDGSLSLDVPGLSARAEPADLTAFEVPHPRPFLCDIDITHEKPGQMSRAIDHVSNVEYVKWLDRAAELHSDTLGYTRERMLADGLMWFVARHEIDYLAEVWPGDRLLLGTWVRDMTRVRSWRDYLVIRPDGTPEGGEVVCRAATLWVLVDLAKRKPVRITPEMVDRFEPLRTESIRDRPHPDAKV